VLRGCMAVRRKHGERVWRRAPRLVGAWLVQERSDCRRTQSCQNITILDTAFTNNAAHGHKQAGGALGNQWSTFVVRNATCAGNLPAVIWTDGGSTTNLTASPSCHGKRGRGTGGLEYVVAELNALRTLTVLAATYPTPWQRIMLVPASGPASSRSSSTSILAPVSFRANCIAICVCIDSGPQSSRDSPSASAMKIGN
jgi:hypothetical protein